MKIVSVKSPFGKFRLIATDKGLYALEFPLRHSEPCRGAHFRRRTSSSSRKVLAQKARSEESDTLLNKAAKLLERYFEGRPVSFNTLRFDLSDLTSFEKKILKTLAKIPSGQWFSYGNLAAKAGFPGAGRAVGSVMRKNRLPIFLPCHRVIAAGHKWGGYSQGLVWKKRLLALEGVRAI